MGSPLERVDFDLLQKGFFFSPLKARSVLGERMVSSRRAAVAVVAFSLAGEGSTFSVGSFLPSHPPPARALPSLTFAAGARDARVPLPLAMDATKKSIFIDEAALLKEKGFPLLPEELIARAKKFLDSRGGFGADPALMAEDFQFMGPVVGPLSKDVFVKAIGSVDMEASFPDFQGEFYGFRVDPFEGNRVWYIARGRGTNTGPPPIVGGAPTNKKLENPPQACSLTYNEQGLVTKYTIGYVMDRTVGTTGGLGGLYGVLYSIGKPLPFPEARPWKMSKRYRLFNKVFAHAHAHAHAHVYVHMRVRLAHGRPHTCTHAHAHTYIHTCTHTHTETSRLTSIKANLTEYARLHARMRVRKHTNAQTHEQTHTHTHTHTNTHTRAQVGNFLQGLKGKEAAVTKDTTTTTTSSSSSSSSGAADVTFDLSMLRGSGRVIEMIGITIKIKKRLSVCTYIQNICVYVCMCVRACVHRYMHVHTHPNSRLLARTHTHTSQSWRRATH
jgi:hypothetical protein